MTFEESISKETLTSVKRCLGDKIEISETYATLKESIRATQWTSEYIKELRNSNPDPKFLSLVEKFNDARSAYKMALINSNKEKAKLYKSLAYKAYAECYSEAGMNDKSEEMTQKYEEEKEGYILGL